MSSSPYRPPNARPGGPRPALPQKKGMAVASLVLGIVGLFTFGLLIVGAIVGIVLGIIAVIRANREPQSYGGKGLAIGGIVTNAVSLVIIPFLGIIAAIAIPSLLRARVSANEVATIGDIRTVISAETVYASANQGFYDSLECLAKPQQCIPGYADGAPQFLDEGLAGATTKNGYDRTFYPGPPGEAGGEPISRSSIRSFAYVAVPTTPPQTGIRSFCGDSDGRICAMADGSEPAVENGLCSRSCPDIQ